MTTLIGDRCRVRDGYSRVILITHRLSLISRFYYFLLTEMLVERIEIRIIVKKDNNFALQIFSDMLNIIQLLS